MLSIVLALTAAARLAWAAFPASCPAVSASTSIATVGVCPQDLGVIGGSLEGGARECGPPDGPGRGRGAQRIPGLPAQRRAHACQRGAGHQLRRRGGGGLRRPCRTAAPARTRPRASSTCQNVVLDSLGQLWAVDSGIPPGQAQALVGGAKLMAFDPASRRLLRTVVLPAAVLAHGTNANDVRVNNSLGAAGTAFLTDVSPGGSLLAVDLATGAALRRLHNSSVTRPDAAFVPVYNGRPQYCWRGTRRGFCATPSDGIALAAGNVYWGVLASRRFYYVPQALLADPGRVRRGCVFRCLFPPASWAPSRPASPPTTPAVCTCWPASTTPSSTSDTLDAASKRPLPPESYAVDTLVRSGLIQHADSAAIMDGYLYFCTNQLALGPAASTTTRIVARGPSGPTGITSARPGRLVKVERGLRYLSIPGSQR